MTPEEDELRRALQLRSGAPSAEFRSRLTQSLGTRPAPTNLTPAIAIVVAVALTVTSVGVLVAARHFGRSTGQAATGARNDAPSPVVKAGSAVQLSAPSADAVWALADNAYLYRSTDQGLTWEPRPVPAQIGVEPSVSFLDDHQGWLLAPGPPTTHCRQASATIWHTVDGGVTWQRLATSGISASQCKSYIFFADSQHGFVTAWDDLHPATIYRTADGGTTWRSAALVPDPPNFQSAQGGAGYQVRWIKAFGSNLYLGAIGTVYVYRSLDGGASWKWITKVPEPAVVMVTETRWLAFSTPGQASESVNGGQAFAPFASDYKFTATASSQLVFADSRVGFAWVGATLERTMDGGRTWAPLATPGIASPSPAPTASTPQGGIAMPSDAKLSAPSADVVWALVANQYLFRSTDQGSTWQQRSLPAGEPFTDLSFVDDQVGWVYLGTPGGTQCSFGPAAIWRTTDAGAHWSLASSVALPSASGERVAGAIAPEQCKENISFIDGQHGFLDAWDPNSAPTIYRTSDSASTWSSSRLPDPPGFRTLAGGDALRAGAVKSFGADLLVEADGMQADGQHSYVFQSTDGGATWTYVISVPQSHSPEVEFVTQARWLKIQSGLETTDAGKTWHSFVYSDEEAAGVFSTFVFATDKVGYATVRGDIRRTVDGGATFVMIKNSWP